MAAAERRTLELPVAGMDCTDCAAHVRHAIAALPGVEAVDVFLNAEKAVVRLDPQRVDVAAIRRAVAEAGYACPLPTDNAAAAASAPAGPFARAIFGVFGVVLGAVLLVVVAGEGLGLFDAITERVPLPLGVALALLAGGSPRTR